MIPVDVDVSRITSPAVLQRMVLMQQREIAELVEALKTIKQHAKHTPDDKNVWWNYGVSRGQLLSVIDVANPLLAKHGA